jgi:hypothetical protein
MDCKQSTLVGLQRDDIGGSSIESAGVTRIFVRHNADFQRSGQASSCPAGAGFAIAGTSPAMTLSGESR